MAGTCRSDPRRRARRYTPLRRDVATREVRRRSSRGDRRRGQRDGSDGGVQLGRTGEQLRRAAGAARERLLGRGRGVRAVRPVVHRRAARELEGGTTARVRLGGREPPHPPVQPVRPGDP